MYLFFTLLNLVIWYAYGKLFRNNLINYRGIDDYVEEAYEEEKDQLLLMMSNATDPDKITSFDNDEDARKVIRSADFFEGILMRRTDDPEKERIIKLIFNGIKESFHELMEECEESES